MAKSPQEQFKARQDEIEPMKQAMVSVILAWADIENALCAVLAAILNTPSNHESTVPHAIYFSPSSLEARIKIVDTAYRQFCEEHEELKPSLDPWTSVVSNINDLKGTRNRVAHGTPSIITRGTRSSLRLTGPFMDVVQIRKSTDKRQLPGISLNDINQSAASAKRVPERLRNFSHLVTLCQAELPKTLRQKLDELVRDHQS